MRPTTCAVACLLILALPACDWIAPAPTPTPTHTPTPLPGPTLTPSPTPEPADTGWLVPRPGVEIRQVRVTAGEFSERLLLVRLDPEAFRFQVLYTPGSAQRVSEWSAVSGADALLVVNGGYFTPENTVTGLLVTDGRVYGSPYGDFAGMFAVLPGGRVQIRWLARQPYDPTEMLVHAVQSFPVLVKPGGVMGFPADADDGRPARRTVVSQDREGRLVFVVAPRGYLSLHEMAHWLVESDLGVNVALNLDGGYSTGLVLAAGRTRVEIDSLVPVPSVIVVR
jgi:uncharacterized protein YigE (DUF2233 family)